jgi:hypothetical protein
MTLVGSVCLHISRRDGAHTLDQFSPPAMIIALERNHRST